MTRIFKLYSLKVYFFLNVRTKSVFFISPSLIVYSVLILDVCEGVGSVFLLSGNPLLCDCTLQWALTSLTVADMRDVTCSHQDQAGPSVSLVSASREQFLCHYTTHCFSLCRCCGFFACDCRMSCPEQCTCLHDEVSTSHLTPNIVTTLSYSS